MKDKNKLSTDIAQNDPNYFSETNNELNVDDNQIETNLKARKSTKIKKKRIITINKKKKKKPIAFSNKEIDQKINYYNSGNKLTDEEISKKENFLKKIVKINTVYDNNSTRSKTTSAKNQKNFRLKRLKKNSFYETLSKKFG